MTGRFGGFRLARAFSARPDAVEGDAGRTEAGRTLRWLWIVAGLVPAAIGIGINWDRAWHTTHRFDDFFSPPHLFIYTMVTLATAAAARIGADPALRCPFGPDVRLKPLPVELPAPFALLSIGLLTVGLAGVLDATWHTLFGLDETGWSTPHAMLGWGIALTLIGLASCRLALSKAVRPARVTPVILAVLVAMSLTDTVLGPIGKGATPEKSRALLNLPALAADPNVQHSVAITLKYNLSRTNPLFLPIGVLAAGVGLGVLRSATSRRRWFLIVSALVTLVMLTGARRSARYLDVDSDPRTYLPLPLIAGAATVVAARTLRVPERLCWLLAGPITAVLIAAWWRCRGPLCCRRRR